VNISFLAAALAMQAPASVDYVPDSGWRDDEWARGFYERWFGNQLRAMGEPPLSNGADLDGFRERIRLLVLPTFKPAFAYRIDVRQDGAATLNWARLDGRGGYAPGALARRGARRLRRSETAHLSSALGTARLAALPRKESSEPITNADGTQTLTICADGTTYVFERLSAEGRQYLTRSCEIEDEGLARLAKFIFRLRPRSRMN